MRNLRRSAAAALIAAASTFAAACSTGTGGNGGGPEGAAPGEDGCTSVVVATSSEKVNLIEKLGEDFKQSQLHDGLDECATIYPINVSSGNGAKILGADPDSWPLKDRAFWPTIWSPASTVWTDRVEAAGNDGVAGATSFARTPVVLGVPESMAKALGYPQKPISLQDIGRLVSDPKGWSSVGKPLWGDFKIAKTNPNTSTTGLSIILMQSYAASGKAKDLSTADVAKAKEFSRTFESGAIHYGDTTGAVLKTLYDGTRNAGGSAYVSAVALEETSLFNYNKGNPDSHTVQPGEDLVPPREKLVAVYPSGGSMWSDNPAVVLDEPWVNAAQKAAGKAFVDFLQTKPAQEVLPSYGFRPVLNGVDVSQDLNASIGIDPAQPKVTLPKPTPEVVSAAIDQWLEIRKPSAVLELIDISGSMDEGIGDGRTRLDGAIDGATGTLDHFRPSDQVGVWAFTTDVRSDLGENLVPVHPFGALGSGREKLEGQIEDLAHARRGGTPLYDAISKAYDYMVKNAQPGRINAIVVLSDGEDTDSETSIDSLLVKINRSAKEGAADTPVRIFTIVYSDDANKNVLARIAKASGGQSFDASDPERIDAVFASVINNF
ncbi:substrate-binding and VWA domain-containing protein [Nocardioides cavernaquae]|uniref:VWA domain-containing protein n=1 Tax=Nocardioides cavernaquae TaxID=2321396 RepID=A0A3A5HFW4_9ACTN|nr:substrate-binding and VWA domain-containing protein [Nocardioides cavernaquae]RJS46944.1 VWA domain-containing protein [Nocardioides cavernaquae]